MIKKIDILHFITDSRKAPNDIKTHSQLIGHLGSENEEAISAMLADLIAQKLVRPTEKNGEKAYQVVAR